jgi:hypothetical protein
VNSTIALAADATVLPLAALAGIVSARFLFKGALRTMVLHKLKSAAAAFMAVAIVTTGVAVFAQPRPAADPPNADPELSPGAGLFAEPLTPLRDSTSTTPLSDVAGTTDGGSDFVPDPDSDPIAADDDSSSLCYHDGKPDGKQSLGGSGEMIEFSAPNDPVKVSGLKIHGARYGNPQPPRESFLIYFLSRDQKRILHTEMAPYSLFERGPEKWVEVSFGQPVELPRQFWIVLDFRAHQTKGVFVSYDTSTVGKHSRQGLPGMAARSVGFGGDWMIEAIVAK